MQDSADHTGRSGDIPAEPQSRGIARRLLSPAAMAILAFAVACTLAMTHYADRGGIGLSWQTSYGPAVFLACTGTFGMPRSDASASRAEWSSALDDFLNERDEAFDCNALPRNLDVGWFAKRAGSSAYDVAVEFSQLGHLFLTGLWWKAVGVSWWGVAYLGALYAGLAFAALTLIYSRFVWAPLALPLALLPFFDFQALHLMERLRDFAKVPFIYAALALLLAIAVSRPGQAGRWVAALGAVLAIGITVRSEMILYAVGVLAIATFVLIARRGDHPARRWLPALGLSACLIVASVLAAALAYPDRPAFMSHALVLGMQDQRLWEAHIDAHSLSLLPIFSDQAVYSLAQLLHAGADPAPYLDTAYGALTADVFNRMVSDAPYYMIIRIIGAAYDFAAGPWGLWPNTLPWQFARAGMAISALVGLVALWRRNAAIGFAVVGVIAMGAAISSLDYEWRHFRHMRWLIFPVTLGGAVVASHWLLVRLTARRAARLVAALNRVPAGRPSPFLLALTTGGLTIYGICLAGTAWLQAHSADSIRAELTGQPAQPVQMQLAPIQGGQRVAFEGEAPSFLARVDFDLRACGKWAVPVRYRVADKIVSGRGKEVRFTIRRGDGKQQYFFTVHDDAQTAFDGLMLRADDVRCLTGAYRVEPLAEPFLYHMLIDGRWRPLGSFRF